MSSHRHLSRFIYPAIEGRHATRAAVDRLDDLLEEAGQPAEMYPEALSPIVRSPVKKHSLDFMQNRLRVRQIAERKLFQLSEELLKLADEVRYHDPLMAEMLDEALESMEAAIDRMQSED